MSEIKQLLDLRLAKGEITEEEYDSLLAKLLKKNNSGFAGILIIRKNKRGYNQNILINNEKVHKLKVNEQFYIEYPIAGDQLSTFVTIHAELWIKIYKYSSNSINLELKDGEVYRLQTGLNGVLLPKLTMEQVGVPSRIENSNPSSAFTNEIVKTVGKTVLTVFVKNALQK